MKKEVLYSITVTVLLILLTSLSSAVIDLKGFPRDQEIKFQVPCRTETGGICPMSISCYLTMQYPNTTVAYSNFNLTRGSTASAYYNVTLPAGMPIGDYNNVEVYCTDGVLNGTESYQFTVRGNGSQPTTTEGMIYVVVIFICTLLLFLSLWGVFGIKGGNVVDENGSVLHVNNLKYLKIFLVAMAYTLLVILAYFGMNLSYNFSSFNLATSIFNWIFTILMSGILPFLSLLFVFMVIKFAKDLKIQKILDVGGEYRGK